MDDGKDLAQLSASEFQNVFGIQAMKSSDSARRARSLPESLVLDETIYHRVDISKVPKSIAEGGFHN